MKTTKTLFVFLFVWFPLLALAQNPAYIQKVDSVISTGTRNHSPNVYFATLYKNMFIKVSRARNEGKFKDTGLIDFIQNGFTTRYLQALQAFTHHDSLPLCWQTALNAGTGYSYAQRLALSTNAHMNHDLYFILLDYFKINGHANHSFKNTRRTFLEISFNETSHIIDNFITTDPNINRREELFLKLGKKRIRKMVRKSLKKTWENALQAARHSEKQAKITQKQIHYTEKVTWKFIHTKGLVKKGFKVLSTLDKLPFETKLQMLDGAVKK